MNTKKDLLTEKNNVFMIEQTKYNGQLPMNTFHQHTHFEILYIKTGKRTIIFEKSQFVLSPNNIAIIAPGTLHKTYSPTLDPQIRYLINFMPMLLEDFQELSSINLLPCENLPFLVLQFDDNIKAQLGFFMNKLVELSTNLDENLFLIKLYLCTIIDILTSHSVTAQLKKGGIYDEIAHFIEENYQENITLELLAHHFNINPYRISRNFKKTIGLSHIELLNKTRIAHAKRMLINSNNIIDIALSNGFNNLTHFERVFKKHVGITPSQFIRENSK